MASPDVHFHAVGGGVLASSTGGILIITVTLNPALDQTVEVERYQEGDTNRVVSNRFDIGGKGINVARVLKELGHEPLAVGFAPGALGRMIEDTLLDLGIGCDFIFVPGETRTNISVLDRSTHQHTVLAAPGPLVATDAYALLRERLVRRVRPGAWVVLAGSIPPPGDPVIYADLIRDLHAAGARVALDADGPVVRRILDAGAPPALLKMNGKEIERLLGLPLDDETTLLRSMERIRANGVDEVVITRGSRGALAVTSGGTFRVEVPSVEVASAIGAGDGFLGGLLVELVRGEGWARALSLAAATGCACCLSPGTLLCSRHQVELLREQVRVERIAAVVS